MDDPDPSALIQRIIETDMTQVEIVGALRESGIQVTQATISRIRKGARTSFEIGMGLLRLYQTRQQSIRRVAS